MVFQPNVRYGPLLLLIHARLGAFCEKKNVPAKLPRRYEMELVWRAHNICWAIFFLLSM